MFQQLFSIVFPIFSIILVGYLYARKHLPDMKAVNKLNFDVFTPALLFSVLSAKEFQVSAYIDVAFGTAFVVLGSGVLAWFIAKAFKFDLKTFIPPVMFTNTGNMGLPLAIIAFGEKALPAAVMIFIVENALHFSVGMKMIDRKASIIEIFKLPIILATFAGLFVSIMEITIPTAFATPIEMIGQIAIPIMLISLGVRLVDINMNDWLIGVIAAIATPVTGVVLALSYHWIFTIPESQYALFILFGAMPPAVFNFLVAEKYDFQQSKVASIVMIGNLASIIFIPLTLAFVL